MHAHQIDKVRSDDGICQNERIHEPTPKEKAHLYPGRTFMRRVIINTINISTTSGNLRVTATGVKWNETTGDGYRETRIKWCMDDCDTKAGY